MSDMLEKAIIDAQALKLAAVKNAETLVLEKYSSQIKSAVESLLEQDDPALPGLDPPAAPAEMEDPFGTDTAPEAPYEESSVMEHIPLAATAKGDDLIEIPLDRLTEEIEALKKSLLQEDETSDEETNETIEEEVETEEDVSEVSLDEDLLEALVEEMIVDLPGAEKTGWLRGASEAAIELAEQELLAIEQDSKVREERAMMRAAAKKINKMNETVVAQNLNLQSSLNNSTEQIQKLKKITFLMKEKVEATNLSNAKLLYQNKALTSTSLNERQKDKLVEAVSSAESVEEAKVIFETLQSTVGSTSRKSRPKSLSEAVQKQSSMILSASRERARRQKDNPTYDRWKFLAGIEKD